MILSLEKIPNSYGDRQVLNAVSLECSRGEICGLIGPNGAGKSTLFRIAFGLVSPDSGTMKVYSTAPKPLGGIIEKPALYPYLSAYDNIKVFSDLQGLSVNYEAYVDMMNQAGLDPDRSDPIANYSTGMKQRLGLAIALLNQPECIILDEPFSGLDPMGITSIQKLILKLARENDIALLISSHKLTDLALLCDTIYVINEGQICRKGPGARLLKEATSAYLLIGDGLDKSQILNGMEVEFSEGKAMISPGNSAIESILAELAVEGIQIAACIPQTNLEALFDV